jgi:hypothetical protein
MRICDIVPPLYHRFYFSNQFRQTDKDRYCHLFFKFYSTNIYNRRTIFSIHAFINEISFFYQSNPKRNLHFVRFQICVLNIRVFAFGETNLCIYTPRPRLESKKVSPLKDNILK